MNGHAAQSNCQFGNTCILHALPVPAF